MNISPAGIEFIKRHEGCELTPYEDPPGSGIFSVGYGHSRWTGGPITQQTADWLLEEDLRFVQACVRTGINGPITQGQFDALCDFVFNEGAGAFMGSTLRTRLNAGDIADAANELLRWDKVMVNGKLEPSQVLAQRREEERALFLSDTPQQPAA